MLESDGRKGRAGEEGKTKTFEVRNINGGEAVIQFHFSDGVSVSLILQETSSLATCLINYLEASFAQERN